MSGQSAIFLRRERQLMARLGRRDFLLGCPLVGVKRPSRRRGGAQHVARVEQQRKPGSALRSQIEFGAVEASPPSDGKRAVMVAQEARGCALPNRARRIVWIGVEQVVILSSELAGDCICRRQWLRRWDATVQSLNAPAKSRERLLPSTPGCDPAAVMPTKDIFLDREHPATTE
jgi:hypothetical protein